MASPKAPAEHDPASDSRLTAQVVESGASLAAERQTRHRFHCLGDRWRLRTSKRGQLLPLIFVFIRETVKCLLSSQNPNQETPSDMSKAKINFGWECWAFGNTLDMCKDDLDCLQCLYMGMLNIIINVGHSEQLKGATKRKEH